MECLYVPELSEDNFGTFELSESEAKHSKALRLKQGDEVLAVNGEGVEALCEFYINKGKPYVNAVGFSKPKQEKDITLAFGMILDKNRMEFMFEKCTELGVNTFQPLTTERTQRPKFNDKRINQKLIAAIKQSKRALLPKVEKPIKLDKYLKEQKSNLIFADYTGSIDYKLEDENAIILIGPEGGFSPREMKLIQKRSKYSWKLSQNRLRMETAAITAASFALRPSI